MAIGYACLTIGIENAGLSSCKLNNANEDNIRKIISYNLKALEIIVKYNINKGVKLFRISSDIIPFGSHPVNNLTWWDEFRSEIAEIGEKIINSGMRVSMHPGQYTVLNSPNLKVVDNAYNDLIYHSRFLDALGVDSKNKIILHIGGVYGDKKKSAEAFILNYSNLPQSIKKRLVIENDDKNYTVEDVLNISEVSGIPVVFDNLHNKLKPSQLNLTEVQWIDRCNQTWKKADGIQKLHYSQQKAGGLYGAHSDTIHIEEFLLFYNSLKDKDIDIMLEVKDKNLSAVKCVNSTNLNLRISALEEEWANYKYLVLSRSSKIYNEIRELLKKKSENIAIKFYTL
ncbi:MAG: UV DNA damage repair endonuclease UvsE, partial [Bacillota bacterium]|nr:UV DNA damage repair endonuclease UvsE [Bacillota bacterium]